MQMSFNVNGHKITLRMHRKNGGFFHGLAKDNKGNRHTCPSLYGPTLNEE